MPMMIRRSMLLSSASWFAALGVGPLLLATDARAQALPEFMDGKRVSGKIVTSAAEAKQILEGARYTADGEGPALYVWVAQSCVPTQNWLARYRPTVQGIQFRYIPVPAVPENKDQVVQLLVSRTRGDFARYMQRSLPAPQVENSNARVEIANDLIDRTRAMGAILQKNRFAAKVMTPEFYWIKGDEVFWATYFGFSAPLQKSAMDAIIAAVKA